MRRLLAIAWALAFAASCKRERVDTERTVPPRTGEMLEVQASDLRAGPRDPAPPFDNPFEGNVRAIEEGAQIYQWFNCNGCHGAIGGGGIGPPLRDKAWIYGSSPVNVYRSILEGRPNGMPSYRGRLSEDAAWKLVAFVASLGGVPDAAETGAVTGKPEEVPQSQPATKTTEEHAPPD